MVWIGSRENHVPQVRKKIVSVQRIAEKSCLLGGAIAFLWDQNQERRDQVRRARRRVPTPENERTVEKKNQDRTGRLNETSAKHAENDAIVADR